MSRINPLSHEISAKIVYYGPGLSGKTTSLQYVHRAIRPDRRGELISLATEGDRTIFFDFLPVHVERVRGMSVRLQLYTVPGQVYYGATRKLVLNGADGVVFVADSQQAARERNLESLSDLRQNLAELGVDLDRFPLVFQYNKRDLPSALPSAVLEQDLNSLGRPQFETAATTGAGVFDALKAIVRLVVQDLNARRRAAERREPDHEPLTGRGASAGASAGIASAGGAGAGAGGAAEATPAEAAPSGLSFAPLWGPDPEGRFAAVETAIASGRWGTSVRRAAAVLAGLLESLPGTTDADGPLSRAVGMGLDGGAFLRMSRLASAPDEAVEQADALRALHLLVDARLKARSFLSGSR